MAACSPLPRITNTGRNRDGRPVPKAGRRHRPARGLRYELESLVTRIRTVCPKAFDGGIDEAGVDLVETLPAQAEPVHHSGAEVLDQNIRPLHQADEHLFAPVGLEVEGDGALIVIEDQEVNAVNALAVGEVRAGAVAAPGVFHLDDIGAQKTEHLRARGASLNMGEVENFHVRK